MNLEKKKDSTASRPRGAVGAVSDGYRLYFENFRLLFRNGWLVAVAYALVVGLFLWHAIYRLLPAAAVGGSSFTSAFAVYCGLGLLFALMAALLASTAISSLRDYHTTGAMPRAAHWWGRLDIAMALRTTGVVAWGIVAYLAVSAVASLLIYGAAALFAPETTADAALAAGTLPGGLAPQAPAAPATSGPLATVAVSVVGLLCLAIVTIVALPLAYTVFVRLMRPRGKLSLMPPVRGYRRGLAHAGMLFGVAVAVVFITFIATAVLLLPAEVMYGAALVSQIGTLYGDPAGMPEQMGWVSFAVFTLAGFLQAWLHLSSLFPFYCAYASIEAEEK